MIDGVVPFPPEFADRYRALGYWQDGPLRAEFDDVFRAHADRVALIDGGERITYRQLDERSTRMARNLADLGLGAGDRVVVQLSNTAIFCYLYFACRNSGRSRYWRCHHTDTGRSRISCPPPTPSPAPFPRATRTSRSSTWSRGSGRTRSGSCSVWCRARSGRSTTASPPWRSCSCASPRRRRRRSRPSRSTPQTPPSSCSPAGPPACPS